MKAISNVKAIVFKDSQGCWNAVHVFSIKKTNTIGKPSIFSIQKCIEVVKQLAFGFIVDAYDRYVWLAWDLHKKEVSNNIHIPYMWCLPFVVVDTARAITSCVVTPSNKTLTLQHKMPMLSHVL